MVVGGFSHCKVERDDFSITRAGKHETPDGSGSGGEEGGGAGFQSGAGGADVVDEQDGASIELAGGEDGGTGEGALHVLLALRWV